MGFRHEFSPAMVFSHLRIAFLNISSLPSNTVRGFFTILEEYISKMIAVVINWLIYYLLFQKKENKIENKIGNKYKKRLHFAARCFKHILLTIAISHRKIKSIWRKDFEKQNFKNLKDLR